VCLAGQPRWAALYDLAGRDAVGSPEYLRVSGENSTPWSRRVLPRTTGYMRVVAEQLWPGGALSLPARDVSRLLIARYRSPAAAWARKVVEEIAKPTTELAGLLQVRAFGGEDDTEFWIIAEYGRPVLLEEGTSAFAAVRGIDASMLNFYAPYWRA
jgi:hypothetical protein